LPRTIRIPVSPSIKRDRRTDRLFAAQPSESQRSDVGTAIIGRVDTSRTDRLYDRFARQEKGPDRMSEMDEANRRHAAKMVKRKQLQDAEVAAKTIAAKGLLMVNTGPGKGKSTAAFGLVLRALGHNWHVGVVQFIKGAWDTGEKRALERFPDLIRWHTMGEGFTWETQDRQRDIAAAGRAWDMACKLMADPQIRLLVLDELNIALRYEYLPVADVVATLAGRRDDLNVIVTGRNAKPELIEIADLVTEMGLIKHHFAAGVKAQAGIEF
jgi:cob(I)alamin adenosyltransferase